MLLGDWATVHKVLPGSKHIFRDFKGGGFVGSGTLQNPATGTLLR